MDLCTKDFSLREKLMEMEDKSLKMELILLDNGNMEKWKDWEKECTKME